MDGALPQVSRTRLSFVSRLHPAESRPYGLQRPLFDSPESFARQTFAEQRFVCSMLTYRMLPLPTCTLRLPICISTKNDPQVCLYPWTYCSSIIPASLPHGGCEEGIPYIFPAFLGGLEDGRILPCLQALIPYGIDVIKLRIRPQCCLHNKPVSIFKQ